MTAFVSSFKIPNNSKLLGSSQAIYQFDFYFSVYYSVNFNSLPIQSKSQVYVFKYIEFLSKFSRTMYRGFSRVDITNICNGWY